MPLFKRRKFANYDEALAFRSSRIRMGYVTRFAKDWQGLYTVEYK